jgi:hypothetical protein
VRGARAFTEPIEIYVIDPQTPCLGIHECERWTCNVLFCDSQRGADAFHKHRLACAQRAAQQKDLAAFESRTKPAPVVERLFG